MSALVDLTKAWINAGLGFFYPEICQICREARATPAESYVCVGCREHVRPIRPPFCDRCGLPFAGAITTRFECANCQENQWQFRSARAAVVACDPVLEIIHQYKYRRAFWFEPFLVELLVRSSKPELTIGEWDCLVPVPLHPTKLREREFNQAERLGRGLSAATGIPLRNRLLRRVIATQTQTLLSREERLANVRGAFALAHRQRLNGERVVLVDDVLTTGATTSACAGVLRRAGAGEVCVWTVARGT